uniref:Uncharacterized protein n=1 Tax=Ditylenchus dipsaci TaxID=166011 RepID=A0A915DWP3_9BILA
MARGDAAEWSMVKESTSKEDVDEWLAEHGSSWTQRGRKESKKNFPMLSIGAVTLGTIDLATSTASVDANPIQE